MRKQPAQAKPTQKPTQLKTTKAKPTLSKAGKKQKNLYLSDQARRLLATFSSDMGISETAVVELLIREKAARESAFVPAGE